MMDLLNSRPALLAVCAATGILGGVWWTSTQVRPGVDSVQAPVAKAPPKLACAFAPGETRAYALTSRVAIADTVDQFEAILSLEVVQTSEAGALLRAAFTDVALE